jgi:hypothetical protein
VFSVSKKNLTCFLQESYTVRLNFGTAHFFAILVRRILGTVRWPIGNMCSFHERTPQLNIYLEIPISISVSLDLEKSTGVPNETCPGAGANPSIHPHHQQPAACSQQPTRDPVTATARRHRYPSQKIKKKQKKSNGTDGRKSPSN